MFSDVARIASSAPRQSANLAHPEPAAHNRPMKALAGLLVTAAILLGIYYFYLKRLPVSDQGTAATQAISLTGVRSDLLQIAQAERANIALNSQCASFDDLVSSGSIHMVRPGRDGYTYSIDCSGTDFTVAAAHPPAPEGSPVRYPTLQIDQNMQVSEVQQ